MRQDFEWVRPEGCPDAADGLPLYKLMEGFVMQIRALRYMEILSSYMHSELNNYIYTLRHK